MASEPQSTPREQIFTILGCSSSPGVPRINGDWGNCDPKNPKNRRRRPALLIEQIAQDGGKTTVVIDTGPDFREQMVSSGVQNIDAVLYTHSHADHLHGIDDLRGFALANKKRVPIYATKATYDHIKNAFGYCVTAPENSPYPPIIDTHLIDNLDDIITIEGAGGPIEIMPIDQEHGYIRSLGFRIGNFAYCSDVNMWPENSIAKLQNLDVIIIDATLWKPHPSHFSVAQAVEWVEKLGAKRGYTTHMHIPLDYDEVMAQTPDHMEPAYDGLQIKQLLGSGPIN